MLNIINSEIDFIAGGHCHCYCGNVKFSWERDGNICILACRAALRAVPPLATGCYRETDGIDEIALIKEIQDQAMRDCRNGCSLL